MNQSTFKSIGAIFAGMITVVALSLVTDTILEKTGVFPAFSQQQEQGLFIGWMLMLAFMYRSIYAIAGGYVTAWLAPNQPMHHTIILGIIGLILSTIGAITMWDKSSHWYPIALAVTALPLTWLGGKLRIKD